MSKSLATAGCLLCLTFAAPALAAQEAVWVESNQSPSYDHHQLAVSVGLRTDQTQSVDAQPEISVKYLLWFGRHTALTTDVGFTNRTSFSGYSEARTFSAGVGLRFREPGGFGSIFFEPGLLMQSHRGDLDGTDFTSSRLGISLSLGVSVSVTKGSRIDLSVRELLNDMGSRPYYSPVPNLPEPPPEPPLFIGGADEYDLYNTTYVLLSYRFAL